VQRLPKAQGPVASSELGRDGEAVLVAQAEQQLAPALGALAVAVLDRQQLLAAVGVGADEDKDALPVAVESWREVDAIGPSMVSRPSIRSLEGTGPGGPGGM
jgi:hypothetical protein